LSAPAHVLDRSSKALSPLLFAAAALCFLLPFAGVSCNTATARTVIDRFSSSAEGAQLAQTNACLDALNGFNLATYSGLNLALGTAPTTPTNPPSECRPLTPAASASAAALPASDAKLNPQPLVIAGGVGVIGGLLLSLLLIGRKRGRASLAAGAAGAAVALLIVAQLLAPIQITDKLASSATAATPVPAGLGINLAQYFTVNWAAGAFIVVALLAVALLLNLAAAIAGASEAAGTPPELTPAPSPAPPHPPPAPPPG
jgi:hypothetical protein